MWNPLGWIWNLFLTDSTPQKYSANDIEKRMSPDDHSNGQNWWKKTLATRSVQSLAVEGLARLHFVINFSWSVPGYKRAGSTILKRPNSGTEEVESRQIRPIHVRKPAGWKEEVPHWWKWKSPSRWEFQVPRRTSCKFITGNLLESKSTNLSFPY